MTHLITKYKDTSLSKTRRLTKVNMYMALYVFKPAKYV